MFYTIYETTNLIDGKKYRGKHITNDPYDNYLGSGIRVRSAIRHHGRKNFTKEILFIALTEDDMNWVEEFVFVDQQWLDLGPSHTYNINLGGKGGCTEDMSSRSRNTVKEKYGVANVMQVPHLRDKQRLATFKTCGAQHAQQSSSVKQQTKLTNLKRYGVENVGQSEKAKQAMLTSHGVEHGLQSPIIREKTRKSLFKNYGVEHGMQSPVIKEKQRASLIAKYGVDNPMKCESLKQKAKVSTLRNNGGVHPSVGNKWMLNHTNKECTLVHHKNIQNFSQRGWVFGRCKLYSKPDK